MKIRIRLRERTLDGIDCAYPALKLRVRDRFGLLVELLFSLDTAADFTTMPLATARREGIPYSERHPGRSRGLAGSVPKFRDRIRLQIAGREHDWPCDFVAEPAGAEPGAAEANLTPVLGRAGLLQDYAVAIDHGYLILTRLGTFRRWQRGLLHWLWERLGWSHPLEKPV
jgi:hypothetical protein